MAKSTPVLFALLLGATQLLAAQELGSITGTVRDSSGVAIGGAEVLLGTRRLQTSPQGRFQIDSLPVGDHFLTIRLVGYTALRSPVAIRAGLNEYNYVLSAAVQSLPTVSVEARRTGLYGTVGDSAFAPLAGARVQLAGRGGGEVLTDSAGRFEFPRASDGQYAVRIVLPGYAEERRFVELKNEEGLELGIRLRASRTFATRADDVAVQELGRRLAMNLKSERMNATQLERFGTLGLCDLPGFVSRLRVPAEGLTIIVNGTFILDRMPGYALCSWRASDVELVEFGDTVCRDLTRTLVDLLKVWCTSFTRPAETLSMRERMRILDGLTMGSGSVQPRGGPFVAIWERR
ncbi:MAG: carboxypeptidase-like regulatory domain-containing protein [Gemmatimonadota bacterium]|nr:carboxypeptidase-like regulatory domain-containing protein [Gemmatimonadota bacterium]